MAFRSKEGSYIYIIRHMVGDLVSMLGWEWSGCLPKLSAVFQAGLQELGHSSVEVLWWPETLSDAWLSSE